MQNLQDNEENICPKCSTVIHETNPFEMLRSDQMLEDIIFKLVPGLQEKERRSQEEFNTAVRSGKRDTSCLKNKHKESDDPPLKKSRSLSRKVDQSDDSDSSHNFHRDDPQIGVCLQYLRNCIDDQHDLGATKSGCRAEITEAEKSSESQRDQSKLNGSMWELVRKYIRCSSRTTIGHIKKYLKLKLNLSAVDQVEVMCNGEIMGKDHTLEFVFMTRWRVTGNTILTLQYRPKLDFL